MRGNRLSKILVLPFLLVTGLLAATPATQSTTKISSPILRMDAEGINRIRQSLLRRNDVAAQFRFRNDVLHRYAAANGRAWDDFSIEPPLHQALEILRQGDAGMCNDVRVLTDPPAMTEFKTQVLPVIVKGCASVGCHGETGVGNFYLSYRFGNDAEAYADFDALRRYVQVIERDKNSMFAAPIKHWMIETTEPEKSLLVQYGLPVSQAELRHPKVKDWWPMLMGKTEPRCLRMINWITELRDDDDQ